MPKLTWTNGDMKHILWDWNGTLLDDAKACVASLNVMLKRRDLPRITVAGYQRTFGFPVREFYVHLGFDVGDALWDGIAREYHALYREFSRTSPLRPGAVKLLAELKARGIAQSVLSACELSLLEAMMRERNILETFDHVCGLPNLYAQSKVHLGRKALLAAGTLPSETLVVGDTTHDFEVAQELGCRCILLAGGHQSAPRLAACGCPVMKDFADLRRHLRRGNGA